MFDRIFLEHPRTVGENYAQHARAAAGFGLAMIAGGVACLVHAVVPALFTHSASDRVVALHAKLGRRRSAPQRRAEAAAWLDFQI